MGRQSLVTPIDWKPDAELPAAPVVVVPSPILGDAY